MKNVLIMPVFVAAMFAAGCSDPTEVDTTPKVRFFNGVWNTPDNIGFAANNQFAAGSALGYLQSSPTCSKLTPGNTSFDLGLANASGTALTSSALASLTNQSITESGNYTVLSGGNVIHPSIILLNNSFSGSLGSNQAAVRFVNLAAAGAGPTAVLKGAPGSGSTTVVQASVGYREATPFSIVPSGDNAYTIHYVNSTSPLISGNDATLNFQAGTINTVVISRLNPPDGNFKLVNVQSCP